MDCKSATLLMMQLITHLTTSIGETLRPRIRLDVACTHNRTFMTSTSAVLILVSKTKRACLFDWI